LCDDRATKDESATGVPHAPFAPLDADANHHTWVRLAAVDRRDPRRDDTAAHDASLGIFVTARLNLV
jgi:hypothetical protein